MFIRNGSSIKVLILFLFSSLSSLSSSIVFAEDDYMDFEVFKEVRSQMIEVLIEAGEKNSYSSLFPTEGMTTYHSPQWHLRMLNFRVHAAGSGLCFFGGWPSYKRKGLCKEPWKYNTKESFGISYDSDHYCGNDNMFRCNPLLFGPGDGENREDDNGAGKSSGKCINFKKNGGNIKSVTKQCFEATKDNLKGLYEQYLADDDFKKNFDKLKEEISLFCTDNPSYSACTFLLERVEKIEEGVSCLDPNGAVLDIGNDAIDGLSEISEHLREDRSQKFRLSLTSDVNSTRTSLRPKARPDNLRYAHESSELAPKTSRRPVARPVVTQDDDQDSDRKSAAPVVAQDDEEDDEEDDEASQLAPQVSITPRARPEDLERSAASISGDSCKYFSKFKSAGVNEKALKQALFYYENNKDKLRKERYISIADYGLRSDKKRFYILDMKDGSVRKEKVSHGSGTLNVNGVKKRVGDPNHDGNLNRCHHGSNTNNRKNMTRGGFFITSSMRNSPNHGPSSWPTLDADGNDSMYMDGMSPGVNDEARRAYVIMHGATYNRGAYMGRSFGCPAFTPDRAASIINTIKEGSLYYSYIPQCTELQGKVDNQVSGWSKMCE